MRAIIEMAREAEAYISATEDFVGWSFTDEQLKAFAALVEAAARAKERERIAKWYESEGHMMFPVAIPNAIRSGK